MDKLPNDPMILFSTLNMLLRDDYSSLDELCDDMNVDRTHLEKKLATVGFEYSKENLKAPTKFTNHPNQLVNC